MAILDLEGEVQKILEILRERPEGGTPLTKLEQDVALIADRQGRMAKDVSTLVGEMKSEQVHRIKNGQRIARLEERTMGNAKMLAMLAGSGGLGGVIVAVANILTRGS